MTPTETSIISADDHPIFRQGLKQLIEKQPGFRVVAEADDGQTALDLIATHSPMVAVLDLNMPGLDGFAVAQRVQQLKLPVRIIILTMHKEIATELGVSPRTIDNHRAHICSKLDLQGSHALTKFAIQHRNEL